MEKKHDQNPFLYWPQLPVSSLLPLEVVGKAIQKGQIRSEDVVINILSDGNISIDESVVFDDGGIIPNNVCSFLTACIEDVNIVSYE